MGLLHKQRTKPTAALLQSTVIPSKSTIYQAISITPTTPTVTATTITSVLSLVASTETDTSTITLTEVAPNAPAKRLLTFLAPFIPVYASACSSLRSIQQRLFMLGHYSEDPNLTGTPHPALHTLLQLTISLDTDHHRFHNGFNHTHIQRNGLCNLHKVRDYNDAADKHANPVRVFACWGCLQC